MIPYEGGLYNFHLLFRVHGSAVYKSVIPALLSTNLYLLVYFFYPRADEIAISDSDDQYAFDDPYAIAVIIGVFTFLLTFRVNDSYRKFWEATNSVFSLQSTLINAGTLIASFHYQSSYYDDVRPVGFGSKTKKISSLRLQSERLTLKELKTQLNKTKRKAFAVSRKFSFLNSDDIGDDEEAFAQAGLPHKNCIVPDKPSNFLKEATHLLSLVSAVGLSTLRKDNEGEECPLIEYLPGAPCTYLVQKNTFFLNVLYYYRY